MKGTLVITGDRDADELLNTDGTALLIGMLLDQQMPIEAAFRGPARLLQRLGHLDAAKIAAMDEESFVAVCRERPAVHRYPAGMGRRIQDLCAVLTDQYDARAENVWEGAATGDELLARLRALPGFGDEKSRIFIAVLGKRMGVQPAGWRDAAGKFGDDTPRSVADSDSPEMLAAVRRWKRAQKAANLDKQDRPLRR